MILRRSLETRRLLLRRHTRVDAPAMVGLLNDWEVARWLTAVPHPYALRDALTWIAQSSRRWVEGEEYQFGIFDRADGALLGHAGVRLEDRGRVGELGYWLGRAHWGQGYATEAVVAVVRFGFDVLHLQRLWAGYLPENVRSLQVLSKAGLLPDGFVEQDFATLGRVVTCPRVAIDRDRYLELCGAVSAPPPADPVPAERSRPPR